MRFELPVPLLLLAGEPWRLVFVGICKPEVGFTVVGADDEVFKKV